MSSLLQSRLAPTELRHRRALVASRPSEPVSPPTSGPRPPATPPRQASRTHSLYSCGSLSYEGVRFSTPVRSRTISTSTLSSAGSPSRLPIGSPAHASTRRGKHKARPSAPTGLGLVDLEKLASAPSPEADASREERAQRRRAVHFNSHAHFSEALRLTLSQRKGMSPESNASPGPPEQTRAPEESPREAEVPSDDDEIYLDDEDFSWEAVSSSPGNTPALRTSSMHELAAAFPSPPKTAPEFPLSLFALDRDSDTPPNLPLPATPPFLKTEQSPHVYAIAGFADSRMTMFDPEESMARLEMSMAKLEGFGRTPDAPEPACFFDDEDDEDDMEEGLDGDRERYIMLQQNHGHVPEDISPPLTSSDTTSATSPLSDIASPALGIADLSPAEIDSDGEARMQRLLRCLSPTAFARAGFTESSPSLASSITASSPRTPSSPLAPLSIELLPEFDFEKTRRNTYNPGRDDRRRSSSLSNPMVSGWQSFASPAMDAKLKYQFTNPNDVRASSSTGTSSGSAYSSVAPPAFSASASSAGHSRNTSADYRSFGTQAPVLHQLGRPDSPLRKARSTLFIHRPVRYEPAQPILENYRSVAPPLPPLPHRPPLPPLPPIAAAGHLPGSLALARSATHSTDTPREAERAPGPPMRVLPRAPSADGHAQALPAASWRRVHSPIGTSPTASPPSFRMSATPSPRTPPSAGGQGHSSFMHITPEQPHSRMSRLWSRARAGLGTKSPEDGKGEIRGLDGRRGPGLKKEKSAKWLRGGVVQVQDG